VLNERIQTVMVWENQVRCQFNSMQQWRNVWTQDLVKGALHGVQPMLTAGIQRTTACVSILLYGS